MLLLIWSTWHSPSETRVLSHLALTSSQTPWDDVCLGCNWSRGLDTTTTTDQVMVGNTNSIKSSWSPVVSLFPISYKRKWTLYTPRSFHPIKFKFSIYRHYGQTHCEQPSALRVPLKCKTHWHPERSTARQRLMLSRETPSYLVHSLIVDTDCLTEPRSWSRIKEAKLSIPTLWFLLLCKPHRIPFSALDADCFQVSTSLKILSAHSQAAHTLRP